MPIERLPSELVSAVCCHLDRSTLYRLTQTARKFTQEAQLALLQRLTLRNLPSFLLLLDVLSFDADEQAQHSNDRESARSADEERILEQARLLSCAVSHATVTCREYGKRGWGGAVGRLIRACRNLTFVRLDGVEDLRMRQLATATGELNRKQLEGQC